MKRSFWRNLLLTHQGRPKEKKGNSRRNFLGKGILAALGSGLFIGSRQSDAAEQPVGDRALKEVVTMSQGPSNSVSGSAIEATWQAIQEEASPEDLYRCLYALPKGGDIHHHLGGGMLPEMIWEILTDPARNGGQQFYARTGISSLNLIDAVRHRDSRNLSAWVTIAHHTYQSLNLDVRRDFKRLEDLSADEKRVWMKAMFLDNDGEGRDEFFEYIWSRLDDVLQSIDVMTELMVENMRRFAAEGVRYMEIQSRFRGWKDAQGNYLTPAEADQIWRDRFDRPDAKATGVLVKFQGVVLRFSDDAEERVAESFAHIHRNKDLWVGINMAGREDDNRGYPSRFTDVYDQMLRKFPQVGISVHAGEAEKKDSHIFDSLRLGATRIGHGINLYRDPPTMQLMRGKQFLIEINLVSNHLLGYTPDLDEHPFPVYLRQGIPCCLNTDDRGMWHSNMTDEYYVAVTRFNLTWKELTGLGENSLLHSFLDEETKAEMLQAYWHDIGAFENRMINDGWKAVAATATAVTYNYGKEHLQLKLR